MRQKRYAGGFLYDPKTKKILLHERDGKTKHNPHSWGFFGGLSMKDEHPLVTFRREMFEELNVNIHPDRITYLTERFVEASQTHKTLYYAEANMTSTKLQLGEGKSFQWFSIEEALALNLSSGTLPDLLLFRSQKRRKLAYPYTYLSL